MDWFKPFKRSEYKVAALMLSVLNLPRRERFRKKWTMIVGIIPGPTEPKIHSNTFLKPLVDDLLCLWRGMPILPDGNIARAALLGVAADMPATRKLTGFLCHKANLGCNRCYFQAEREPGRPGATGRMSYYTQRTCRNRSKEDPFQQAQEFKAAATKTEFYQRLNSMCVPYDIGRLPTNFGCKTSFSGFTAQQWKNYAIVYAKACLWGLLPGSPSRHYTGLWSTPCILVLLI